MRLLAGRYQLPTVWSLVVAVSLVRLGSPWRGAVQVLLPPCPATQRARLP
jgi:hypothetical protein